MAFLDIFSVDKNVNPIAVWSENTFGEGGPLGAITRAIGQSAGEAVAITGTGLTAGITQGLFTSEQPTGERQADITKIVTVVGIGVLAYLLLKRR